MFGEVVMSVEDKEMLSLLAEDKKTGDSCFTSTVQSTFFKRSKTAAAVVKSLPMGIGNVYSLLGPLAMLYKIPAGYVLGSVGTGLFFSLSNEVISSFAKKYPDNNTLKILNKGSYAGNQCVGFLGDIGFSASMFVSIAIYAGGVQYGRNEFAKLGAPFVALLPSVFSRYVNHLKSTKELSENSMLMHVANTLDAAAMPTVVASVLTEQGLLAEDSVFPMVAIVVAGLSGLLGSVAQKYHPFLGRFILSLVEMMALNPSLAATGMQCGFGIVAQYNNHELPDMVFEGGITLATLFLVVMNVFTLMELASPESENKATITEINEENSEKEDDLEQGTFIADENDNDDEDYESQLIRPSAYASIN